MTMKISDTSIAETRQNHAAVNLLTRLSSVSDNSGMLR